MATDPKDTTVDNDLVAAEAWLEEEDDDIDIDDLKTDDTTHNEDSSKQDNKSNLIDSSTTNQPKFDNDLFVFEPLNINDEQDRKHDLNSNTNSNTNTKNTKTHTKTNAKTNTKTKTFSALSAKQLSKGERRYRAIRVPGPRMIHVRRLWKEICDPIVTQLKLQIRMNSKKNLIEIRTSKHTTVTGAVQKGADFVKAAVLGFEIKDAIALLRMDDIYLESFDIRDVKFFNKKSDHWLRAIGRIAGQYGKIKYSIENSTNTRLVIFGFKVHILGSFTSIRLARNAISRLVMGSAPGNVYANLRVVSNRMKNRF